MSKRSILRLFFTIFSISFAQNNYPSNSKINNEEWLDTNGDFIHAHDGSITEYNKIFYWIGGSVKLMIGPKSSSSDWASEGVNCYSSTDLINWRFEGMIFKNTSINVSQSGPYKINNPHVIHNAKNNNFVLWMRIDTMNDALHMSAVATSNTICGSQYQFLDAFHPDGVHCDDMSIYKDIDQYNNGNTAYLIRNVQNQGFDAISQLNDDYTNTTSDGIIDKKSNPDIEGLSVFKLSTYYLWGSHLSNYKPNAAVLCVTNQDDTLRNAQWSHCDNPTGSSTTYNSQGTNIVRFVDDVNKVYTFMFMGDIWNYPNLTDATYVWLPIVFKDNAAESYPHVPYYKQWTIGLHNISIP